MLDLGCSDHITHEYSDFSDYHTLASLQFLQLADGTTCISYIGTRTAMAMTCINGIDKTISLCNVIHCPEIGDCFLSIWKLIDRGIDTVLLVVKRLLVTRARSAQKGYYRVHSFGWHAISWLCTDSWYWTMSVSTHYMPNLAIYHGLLYAH